MMRTLLLLLTMAAAYAQTSTYGACYTGTTSCCFDLSFETLPGYNNASGTLRNGQLINASTFGALGVNIWSDVKRPDTHQPYPLGLLNVTALSGGELWGALKGTNEGLTLTPLDTLVPLRPLRLSDAIGGIYTTFFNFTSVLTLRKACIASVRLIRTREIALRMSARVTLLDEEGGELTQKDVPWSVSVQTNIADVTLGVPEVNSMEIDWIGMGFGAIAFVRVCYPRTQLDACGVCGGDGSVCGAPQSGTGPRPGAACLNSTMTNPACQPGRYDTLLHCIPNLFNLTAETCNGVDDDCDGVIDGGAAAFNETCGIGECKVTIWHCGGNATFNDTCIPLALQPEICDGLDNNCNGLIDENHVCDRPVEGVAVVPVALCVEGRVTQSPLCFAHFGYRVLEPIFNVTLVYPSERNNLLFADDTPSTWQAVNMTGVVPTLFAPNASITDAFKVPLPACSGPGSSIVWQIGDGVGHYLEAEVDAESEEPCETGNYTLTNNLTVPITPLLDEGCVRRTNGTCAIRLGYYNPNSNTPVAFVAQSQPGNYLYITGAAGAQPPSNPLPNLFFSGRVRGAYEAQWACITGFEVLHWSLTTAGVTREAVARTICNAGVLISQ